MPAEIQITPPASAEALWVIRDRVTFKGGIEGTDMALLEVEVPPGSGTPPHRHASAETFVILTGEIQVGMFDGGAPRLVKAGPGTVVTIPSSAAHNYANVSAAPASMLAIVKNEMTEFFRDLGQVDEPQPGPPSAEEIARVMASCRRHQIEILDGAPA